MGPPGLAGTCTTISVALLHTLHVGSLAFPIATALSNCLYGLGFLVHLILHKPHACTGQLCFRKTQFRICNLNLNCVLLKHSVVRWHLSKTAVASTKETHPQSPCSCRGLVNAFSGNDITLLSRWQTLRDTLAEQGSYTSSESQCPCKCNRVTIR